MMAIREVGVGDSRLVYEALRELRLHLGSVEEVARQVDEVQRPEGYRLVGSFVAGEDSAAACAGFRVAHNTAWGFHMYVDDLSTRAVNRRQGHGGALVDWLLAEARRLGCQELHLDSGHHRHQAHRLYLGHGLRISAHHFRTELDDPPATK